MIDSILSSIEYNQVKRNLNDQELSRGNLRYLSLVLKQFRKYLKNELKKAFLKILEKHRLREKLDLFFEKKQKIKLVEELKVTVDELVELNKSDIDSIFKTILNVIHDKQDHYK